MDAKQVRLQLDRILSSAGFAEAERASCFLRFVVERKLEGLAHEIKEAVIAIEVLGRTPSFDSKSDPIVRVEAGRLRDRLNAYYEAEGGADPLLISLPKGRYVPEFIGRRPLESSRSSVLRLSILPPENASFESFAVSPDGRMLAFTAPLNGRMMLWVRALDSLEVKPLAGTDNADWPFWSPDSLSIAFFARNKLKVAGIDGGPVRDIADILVGLGGSWNAEGVILFCPRPIGVLYKVSPGGGAATPVTSLDESRAEVSHGFPQFLPDGRQFLYLAASSHPGDSSIRAGSLDSTSSKFLLSADTGAAYAPTLRGHPASLLFVHDGALMAQAFDCRELELSGERTVMVPQVRHQRWRHARFSVSANGILLYQSGRAENRQFAWFDRQGGSHSTVGPRNDYISFSLSPNERYVAVNRVDDQDTAYPTIWVLDLSREGAVFRFTDPDTAQANFNPVWSPDSNEIVFSRGDDRQMRLFRQALSGGTARLMLDTEGPKFPTDWSSDGRFISYSSQAPDYRHLHIWLVALDIPEPRSFLQHAHEECSAQFSPADSGEGPRWLAYTSRETGRYEVYVRDFPGGQHKWQISSQGGFQPHWRRDSRELFYLTLDGKLMSVAVTISNTFEFETPAPLFQTGLHFLPQHRTWMNQYAVSRDGQRFLLNRWLPEAAQCPITAVIPW